MIWDGPSPRGYISDESVLADGAIVKAAHRAVVVMFNAAKKTEKVMTKLEAVRALIAESPDDAAAYLAYLIDWQMEIAEALGSDAAASIIKGEAKVADVRMFQRPEKN